jgi:hypothetical protein
LKAKIEKIPFFFKSPAKHLKNIIVDFNNNKVNQPVYVKHKRRLIPSASDSDSEISDVTSGNISSDGEEILTATETKIIEKQGSSSQPKGSSKTRFKSKIQNVNKKTNADKIDDGKRHFEETKSLNTDGFLKEFNAHIPHWGGTFENNGKRFNVTNTCTIDNYLFAFWVMSKISPGFLEKIQPNETTNAIKEIVSHIDMNNWDKAKQTWFLKVMRKDISKYKRSINFYGEVETFFLQYVLGYQNHSLIQICTNSCSNNGNTIITEDSKIICLGRQKNEKNNIGVVSTFIDKCTSCKNRITCDVKFSEDPQFLFMETNSLLKIKEIPGSVQVDFKKYQLLCVILYLIKKRHFVSVFYFNNNYYLVDDLSPKETIILNEANKKHLTYFKINISSALYCKSS